MKSIRLVSRFALLMVLAVLLAPVPRALATEAKVKAALDLVPADSAIVVVVPDLAGLSTKIATFGQTLNLGVPEMADLLGTVKKLASINDGLKDDGPAVLVLPDIQGVMAMGMGGPPPIMLFLPAKDYKALVGNFNGNAEDAVATLTLPMGGNAFARKVGDFALVGLVQGAVQGYTAPAAGDQWVKALGKLGVKNTGKSDAMTLINIEAIAPTLQPLLTMGLGQMQQQFAGPNPPPGMNAAQAKMAATMMVLYGDAIQAVLRDGKFLIYSADLSDKGIGITYTAQFKPESYLAKIFGNGGGAAAQMAKLPDAPYLLAAGWSTKGIDVPTLTKDIVAKLPQGADDMYSKMFKLTLPLLEKVQGGAVVYFAPQNKQPGASGLLTGVSFIETSDAPGYIAGHKAMIDELNKTPAAGADNAMPAMTAKYTENALQVDGLNVAKFEMQMTMPTIDEPSKRVAAVMGMLGMTNQSGYVVASGNHVIMTLSPDEKILKQALASVKATNGVGASKLLAEVRKDGMPENATMEFYLHTGSIASVINSFTVVMGMPAIQVPAELPPIGLAVEAQEGGLAGRLYVPISVIQFIKDAAAQNGLTLPGGGPGRAGHAPPF